MISIEQQAARYRAIRYARRFRFVGRSGDTYVWERPGPDSRVEQVWCNIDWFWRST